MNPKPNPDFKVQSSKLEVQNSHSLAALAVALAFGFAILLAGLIALLCGGGPLP